MINMQKASVLEFTDEFGDKLSLGSAGLGHTGVSTSGPQGTGPVYVLSPEEAVKAAQQLLKNTGYTVTKRA